MPNKILLNLSNNIKASKQNKLSIIKVKFSKKVLNVISVLLKEGLIRGYFLKNKYVICILLKYVNDENIINLKTISQVNRRVFSSSSFIKNNFTSFNCCIISTRKAVLHHRDASNSGLGGFPMLNFF